MSLLGFKFASEEIKIAVDKKWHVLEIRKQN
jgi:hypothetical protein